MNYSACYRYGGRLFARGKNTARAPRGMPRQQIRFYVIVLGHALITYLTDLGIAASIIFCQYFSSS